MRTSGASESARSEATTSPVSAVVGSPESNVNSLSSWASAFANCGRGRRHLFQLELSALFATNLVEEVHHLLANLKRGCRRGLHGHWPSRSGPNPVASKIGDGSGPGPGCGERDSVREALFRRRRWRPGPPDDIPDPVDHEIRDLRPDDPDRVDLVDLHLCVAHRHVDVDPAGHRPLQQRPADGAEPRPAVPDHAVDRQDDSISQLVEAHHRLGRADAHQRLEDLPVVLPVDRRADEHPYRFGLLRVRDRDAAFAFLERCGVEQLAAGAERVRDQLGSVVVLADVEHLRFDANAAAARGVPCSCHLLLLPRSGMVGRTTRVAGAPVAKVTA